MWTAACATHPTRELAHASRPASTGSEPERLRTDRARRQGESDINCPQPSVVSVPLVVQREEARLTVAHFDGSELVPECEVPTNGRVAEAHACRSAGQSSGARVSWVTRDDRRVIRVADEAGSEQVVEFDEPVRAHAWVEGCSAIVARIGAPLHGAVITRSMTSPGQESDPLKVAGGTRLRSLGDQRRFAIGNASRLLILDVLRDERRWVEVGAYLEGPFDVHQCGERLVHVATDWESDDRASHGVNRVFDQALGPEARPAVVAGLRSLHVESVAVAGNILFAVGWPLVNARGRAVPRNADGYPTGAPSLFAVDLSSSDSTMVGPISDGILYFDR